MKVLIILKSSAAILLLVSRLSCNVLRGHPNRIHPVYPFESIIKGEEEEGEEEEDLKETEKEERKWKVKKHDFIHLPH